MSNETKNNLREKFLRAYANLPLNTRREIILVLEEENGREDIIKQPITWEVAYFEIKNNTPRSEKILEKLDGLKLI
jgi:CO dehydrogenase/acetyl-CoA synthase alpha subunit